jgi:hypothetical protein
VSVLSNISNTAAAELGQRLFNAADTNHDDRISSDEFRSLLASILGNLSSTSAAGHASPFAATVAGAGGPAATSVDDLPFGEVPGFVLEKLKNTSHVTEKYTASVRLFSKALAATGAQPDASGLQQVVDWLNAHGATASASKDMLTINGDAPVDVITDFGGPSSTWWFNNVPQR